MKLPVQVWTFPEEIATVDACAAELRQQSDGAAFSRAEALRIAAMAWLKARQARHPYGQLTRVREINMSISCTAYTCIPHRPPDRDREKAGNVATGLVPPPLLDNRYLLVSR